jgi:hypothetical protein
MDIEYSIDIDDVIAWNLYQFANSPKIQRQMKIRKIIYITPAIFSLLLGLLLLLVTLSDAIPLFIIGLFLLFYCFYKPFLIRKRISKEVISRYNKGKNDVIGKHEFSITPDKIHDFTEVGEQGSSWDIIESIASTEQYLYFIMRGSQGAYVIPKKAFTDDAAFNQFAETAKNYHQEATAANKTA